MGEKRAEAREKVEEKKTTRMFWQVVLHINIFFFSPPSMRFEISSLSVVSCHTEDALKVP